MPRLLRVRIAPLIALIIAINGFGVLKIASAPQRTNLWWSLRPIVKPQVPEKPGKPASHPIDAFIQAKLEEQGLEPAPEADRQTLIRRVFFDLTGLPPSFEQVQRFVRDPDPFAYERLVDQLLASPAYGERWARHWLDVVHYGDTHGYDKDQPRPYAWTYRDYVIRAFNADKPYSRFVREQIAGDVLFPNTADGIEALGFISAGPWDLIGHAELPESKTDGKIARHLDRDDMVANTMSTFTSLTVHCAQCHDHKFDPITSEDYYSLQAVFAAVDRTTREYYDEPALNKKRADLVSQQRDLTKQKSVLDEKIAALGGSELATLRKEVEAAGKGKGRGRAPQFGYHSEIDAQPDAVKWAQVDLGRPVEISQIRLFPCSDDFAGIGDGFGFPRRFKIEASNDAAFASKVVLLQDRAQADQSNPGITPQSYAISNVVARYVRVTATRLAPRQNDYIFALAELEVTDSAGKNAAAGAPVAALDSIEAPVRWTKANLVDGIYPAAKADLPSQAELQQKLTDLINQKVDSETLQSWRDVTNSIAGTERELSKMPKPKVAFVGAVHYGSGSFRGTGPDGGKPRPIYVLPRGDVRRPAREVVPGAISAISVLPARFESTKDSSEGERRKALANWLTDSRNPLTWRSIVNRVWQYHFGRGLVDSPNDFGKMGATPSHPELLDWLAADFRDNGQSLKKLHRLILTSATYRQVSSISAEMTRAEAIDHDNRLLWRMNRRKIEAEAIRDSILAVSGELNPTMFGPAFKDFVVEKPEHSPHYEYHLFDPADPSARRRSIYRFIVRSQPQPFMAALDCADPSMLVDRRNESVSALQALALLNNGFVVTMAEHFAENIAASAKTPEEQVRITFSRALSRMPSPSELNQLVPYTEKEGLANTCRLIFNVNEFAFVD